MFWQQLALCLLLILSRPGFSAETDAFGRLGVYGGFLRGYAVGRHMSSGGLVGYYFGDQNRVFQPRIEVNYLQGSIVTQGYHENPYEFYSSLLALETGLDVCPIRHKVWFCPVGISVGPGIREVGGRVSRELGGDSEPYEGETMARTQGLVVNTDFKVSFGPVFVGLKILGLFSPISKLSSRDTFSDEATEDNKRISDKAFKDIHQKSSSLFLRAHIGFLF